MSANDAASPTKYLVTTNRDSFVIEVPAGYKITFGAVNPGSPNGGYGDKSLHCLRVWTGGRTKELRAVFCDVRGVRDLSLPLARKVEKETGSAEWTMDSAGGFERSERRELETGFQLDDTEDPFTQ